MLTATTYLLAGHMREQVCVYMCPWPRIQAALTDEHALNVTYRYDRGEPRGSTKKSALLRQEGRPAGDCIDCFQCVNVCPTGVDIRDGSQLGCIDACDTVMRKIGRPERLIAYDTEVNVKRRMSGLPTMFNPVRARTVLYTLMIAVIGGLMLYTLATRHSVALSVIHDRNPIFVKLADGAIRNGYNLRIINKERTTREFSLSVEGLPASVVEIVGLPRGARKVIEVGPDQTQEARVLISNYDHNPPSSTPIRFHIIDTQTGERAHADDHFRAP
jgi:cytochrome c oxidase accessory protein FixG